MISRVEEPEKTKKKKKKHREICSTNGDIFENTPKMERTYNLIIPSGLSPPDFSAIKMEREEEGEEKEEKNEGVMVELPVSWMSPFLNLNSPHKKGLEEKPIIPLARKLNFSE